MESNRRRQHHSCDQCRKGKRACDAAVRDVSAFSSADSAHNINKKLASGAYGPCSTCRKYKKECTFNWLSESLTTRKGRRKIAKDEATSAPVNKETVSPPLSQGGPVNEINYHSQWLPDGLEKGPETADPSLPWSVVGQTDTSPDSAGLKAPIRDQFSLLPWDTNTNTTVLPIISDSRQTPGYFLEPASNFSSSDQRLSVSDSMSNSIDEALDMFEKYEDLSPGDSGSYYSSPGLQYPDSSEGQVFQTWYEPAAYGRRDRIDLCFLSDTVADRYARFTMTQNLIRIYHDSMENALSCWLTEQNCPYNLSITSGNSGKNRPPGVQAAWAPNWTNRICSRVCRLDRAFQATRNQTLSDSDEKLASRTLHTVIMAFASQWAQNSPRGSVSTDLERSIRETLWNKARRALEDAAGIQSFRVIFSNILFSIAQRPLNISEDVEVHELFENDSAPLFMESAIRQLFSIRYKLAHSQRQTPKNAQHAQSIFTERRSSDIFTASDVESSTAKFSKPSYTSLFEANSEYQDTFNLLFWLAVMFDTLTAVMYQRPLAVSDEDSQIISMSRSSFSNPKNRSQVDLDGWNTSHVREHEKQDLWDEFFLKKTTTRQKIGQGPVRWPCSYEEAAETLSNAAPEKVLLFRRITHLQTLIYRGSSPEEFEAAIQRAIRVYQHWNFNYKPFFLDCITNHDRLPARIQSWYVLLAGHWHLAAMILADVVQSIDQAQLGLDSGRESRNAINFVSSLRRDNAFIVGSLARGSLQGEESFSNGLNNFHDSISESALLTEPWTVVLVRSFSKAASIHLDDLDLFSNVLYRGPNDPYEQARKSCEYCISALWCLGRKSDMAFLAALKLSKSLSKKLEEQSYRYSTNNTDVLITRHNFSFMPPP